MKPITRNTLFYGDNLHILRDHIPDASVDLIYLDPPFNSNRSYNVLFRNESGDMPASQIQAFDDTWHWGQAAEGMYDYLVYGPNQTAAAMISAMRKFIGTNQMMAYLVMMAARLIELHRVLKPTGSLYLHCDPTASHYLKILMDTIFGFKNYRSEITWLRSRNPKGSQFDVKQYSPDTDIILFYAKSVCSKINYSQIKKQLSEQEIVKKYDRKDELGSFTDGPILRSPSMEVRPNLVYAYKNYTPGPYGWRVSLEKLIEIDNKGNLGWSSTGKPYRKLRPSDDSGGPIGNCWIDISSINPQAQERLGYPTQKPLALLERILLASSNTGDVVLDPFSGCGTAITAAQKLGRRWIGIDITHLAINAHKRRLKEHFLLEPERDYDVIGEPKDAEAARQLASDDRYQFQWWALSLIKAMPFGAEDGGRVGKKGGDSGIDGTIPFIDDASKKYKRVIVSVKSGRVSPGMLRDLRGVIERETDAPIGVFLTMEEPSKDMLHEAIQAGFYTSDLWQKQYPRLQIITIARLLAGEEVKMPPPFNAFKEAERIKVNSGQMEMGM